MRLSRQRNERSSAGGTTARVSSANGTITSATAPVTVQGISTATAITAGDYHTSAALSNGTMRCWGDNDFGKLGNGKKVDSSVPVSVAGSATGSQMAAAYQHACARTSNGAVTCGGRNDLGQLGNSGGERTTPLAVPGIVTASMVSTTGTHTCARLTNGTIKCWGNNANGRLGIGIFTGGAFPPNNVFGITNATSVSAGWSHTCARLQDGTVRC